MTHNPQNLPEHLIGMTQEKWNALSPKERDTMRDTSHLHPRLIGLEGQRVEVYPKREYGPSKFRVGISTGWRPCHLAMRANARGSSDVIRADEDIRNIGVLGRD